MDFELKAAIHQVQRWRQLARLLKWVCMCIGRRVSTLIDDLESWGEAP